MTEAIVAPVSGPLPLQRAVKIEGILADKFSKIHGIQNLFSQLILVHQKAHGNIFDQFTELNAAADTLAKSHAREIAANVLPDSATPHQSFDVGNSLGDELEQDIATSNLVPTAPTLYRLVDED